MVSMLLIALFLFYQCECQKKSTTFPGNTFVADSNDKYHNNTIQCADKQNCTILCQDYPNACRNAEIRCPRSGNCEIVCSSAPSYNVCRHMSVTCPSNGDCSIACREESACQSADIKGQTAASLTMSCDGDNTCDHLLIDAREATRFMLRCGSGASNTCTGLTVFFPPRQNGEKKASIVAGDQCSAMELYAYNGWSDVNVTAYIGSYQHHIGTMHCGDLYEKSCPFKSDAWRCEVCNNPTTSTSMTSTSLTQTDTRTISALYAQTTLILTVLYVIIAILGVCLCCLAGGGLYYVNVTQRKLDANAAQIISIPSESISELPCSNTKFVAVRSISKSSTTPNATTTSPTSPTMVSEVSGASSKAAAMLKAFKSYSNRSCSVGTPQPSSPQVSPATNVAEAEDVRVDCVQLPITEWQNTTATTATITSTIGHLQPKHSKPISLPSTTTSYGSYQQSVSSNNNSTSAQIVYQQPPQHQVLQMMSMMNQSQPPSLSEFIQNTNYVVNQNPIPPTPTQDIVPSPSGSRYSVSITKTSVRHATKPTSSDSMSARHFNGHNSFNSLQSLNDGNESESDGDPNDIIQQLQMAMKCLVSNNTDNVGDENVDVSVDDNATKAYAGTEPNMLATHMDEIEVQTN